MATSSVHHPYHPYLQRPPSCFINNLYVSHTFVYIFSMNSVSYYYPNFSIKKYIFSFIIPRCFGVIFFFFMMLLPLVSVIVFYHALIDLGYNIDQYKQSGL